MLRIFEAHFRQKVKNTEPGKKIHHSYKKNACSNNSTLYKFTNRPFNKYYFFACSNSPLVIHPSITSDSICSYVLFWMFFNKWNNEVSREIRAHITKGYLHLPSLYVHFVISYRFFVYIEALFTSSFCISDQASTFSPVG